jgi:hypothetical protein
VGQLGDGWFPWREPNETMRGAVERIHKYASEAGRDPSAIGLEPQLNVGRGQPDEWRSFVTGWRDLGATHLCLSTMGNGFASPAEHIAALTRAAEELGVGAD